MAFAASPAARLIGHGGDFLARRKDGSEVEVEIGLSPIQTAEGSLALGVIVDISDRKRAEEAEVIRQTIEAKQPDRAELRARLLARGPGKDVVHAVPGQ